MFAWQRVLFVGDALYYDLKTGQLEPGPEWMSVDAAANRRSLAALKSALGDQPVDVVCTGHGGCTPPAQTQKLLDDLIKRVKS
jgi:glyoxylase-like metal-dependent hydrolase (beta-lactamase superfamily II)